MIIDHIGFGVSNYDRAKDFYLKALAPLGIGLVMEVGHEESGLGGRACGLGRDGKPEFWLGEGGAGGQHLHVAFAARTRAEVDAFYRAALAAGGGDNGAPGLRPHYHPNYYGAFVLDADGNNIEAVCHAPA